jgi:hypothetical protein
MQIQFLFHKQDYCLGFPKVLSLNRIILSGWPDDKKKISKELFLNKKKLLCFRLLDFKPKIFIL